MLWKKEKKKKRESILSSDVPGVMKITDENFTFTYSTAADKAYVDDKHVGTLRETANEVPG